MSVLKDIKSAQLQARKDKNKFRTGILTALMSEVAIIGKNQGIDETLDVDALKIITKFKKSTSENISLIKDDISNKGNVILFLKEVELYDEFLPKLMSEEELSKLVSDMIDALPNPNIGMIMGQLKKSGYAYDGKMASGIIRNLLK